MNKIKVILKHVTPEFVVNEAVGMPYDTPPSSELTGKVIGIKKHMSCAEHIVINWHVIGSSRLELQEHMRHRMASPTVQSTRYVMKKLLDSIEYADVFVTPDLSGCVNALMSASIFPRTLSFTVSACSNTRTTGSA